MATSSHVDTIAQPLRLAVARTARRLRQEASGGLSPTLMAALATVDVHGPLSPSELAQRERIARPNATKLIARLEAMELVRRTPSPVDGRSCTLDVTEAGRALMEDVRTRKDAFLADRLQRLDEDDLATLARAAALLEQLLEDPS